MSDPARNALCACGHAYRLHLTPDAHELSPAAAAVGVRPASPEVPRGKQIGCCKPTGAGGRCPCRVFVDRARWPFVLPDGSVVLRGLLAR